MPVDAYADVLRAALGVVVVVQPAEASADAEALARELHSGPRERGYPAPGD